jgi:hypothetical protein
VRRHVFGWWFLAEAAVDALTAPRTDISASDRKCERLLLDSALWSFGDRAARQIRAAWLHSGVRRSMETQSGRWPASDPIQLLHAIGWVMTVSAVTTLGLQAFGALRERLGWAVPVAVAAGGLMLPWIADRARARTKGIDRS